jgi:hypothetical protein
MAGACEAERQERQEREAATVTAAADAGWLLGVNVLEQESEERNGRLNEAASQRQETQRCW